MSTSKSPAVVVVPVALDHSFAPGDDVAAIAAAALSNITWPDDSTGLLDGDIVVITSKVVAKSEGQIVQADSREEVIDAQAERVVATKHTPRGVTKIVQTSHGLVLAAAGVDASNTQPGTVVLLPEDSDASAEEIRRRLTEVTGKHVGVLITDTMGRPWRLGVTDVAIGASGVRVLDDHTGRIDPYGNTLEMTVVALADEIASAVDLATGKLGQAPIAAVRGLGDHVLHAGGQKSPESRARDIVRPLGEDLFWLGTDEALQEGARRAVARRRTVRKFTDAPVDPAVIERAIEDAVLAPAPHHTEPFRFIVLRDDVPNDRTRRSHLLDALREAWINDLRTLDDKTDEEIKRRVARGDILRHAPVLVVPIVDLGAGGHSYVDARRNQCERDMFLVAAGGCVENFLIRVAAEGLGAAWISSTLFAPGPVRDQFNLPDTAIPVGAVAVGHPAAPAPDRPSRMARDYIIRID